MKYAYENLSPQQFENLIVIICQQLFGIATQGFSSGPDGGRDARFEGVAECFPSKAAPWKGRTIIQAKHTNGFHKSYSDADFYSETAKNCVIAKELPRIRKLRENGQLDHYILFANRRLAGNTDNKIRQHISQQTGVQTESIYLCDIEQIELYLKQFTRVVQMAGIDMVDAPLNVSPDDLADVIEALVGYRKVIVSQIDNPPTSRVSYDEKNVLNNMSPDYAEEQRKRYLKETAQIKTFLADPNNLLILRKYESVAEEFQLKVIAKRKNYQEFDEVMEHLIDLLCSRDVILRKNKKLTRVMLFYMYWNCDIGLNKDAETN